MLRKIMPHVAIVISMMYFVFFCIDRVNSAMVFINNDITKWLLVLLGIASIYNSVALILRDRRRAERRNRERISYEDDAPRRGSTYKRSAYKRYR